MKGIALSTIALIVLALIGVILLITLVGVTFSPALKKGYCDMIRGFAGLLPLPEYMKPSLPYFCTGKPSDQQEVTIEAEEPDKIAYDIAGYCLACWEKYGKINVGQNTNCYELILKRIIGNVTEARVLEYIPEGYKDKIDWQVGTITTAKSIGIYYNATTKLIVVI